MKSATEGLRLFSEACDQHQRSQFAEAERSYRSALEHDPGLVDAWRNLGAMLRQQGRPGEGVICQRRAIELKPDDPGLLGNLGNALRDLGDLEGSKVAFEEAVKAAPERFGPRLGLAITLNALKENNQLLEVIQPFIETANLENNKSDAAQLLLEMGNAAHNIGQKEKAISLWKKAQEYAEGEKQLSMVLNTAQVMCENSQHAEAEKLLLPHLNNYINHPNILYALGVTIRGQGRWEEAAELFEKAIHYDPNYAICLNTYGLLLREMGKIHKARECFEKALAIDEKFGAAMNNLGSVLKDVACYDDALKWLRKGAEQLGDNPAAHSNVLFTLVGYELEPAEERYEEARRYGKYFSKAKYERWLDRVLLPDVDKKLRIGLVSPDFCRHAVSYFIEPLLEQWTNRELEVYLYAAGTVRDDYSERLKKKADYWRDIQSANDEQVVQQIQQDEIDILIDLAGHTAGNRLTIFTHKPAPIQATYLGYYGTTGIEEVDYWITDTMLHPNESEEYDPCSEKKWKLPRSYVSYKPLDNAPDVAPLPMIERGIPVIGSFNQSRKITSKTAESWMSVLNAIPEAHLYLKSKNLGEDAEADRIKNMFQSLGLKTERLHLEGHSPNVATHLDRYRNIDIALDTFPYTGCTTTADALWMGVPVLTISGTSMVSRQAAAVLKGAGHAEWICESNGELVSKAKDLINNPTKLSNIRQKMRDTLYESELLDHEGLAICLHETFRKWWKDLLENKKLVNSNDGKVEGWPIRKGVKPIAKFSMIPR